jgi:hypothetical protein
VRERRLSRSRLQQIIDRLKRAPHNVSLQELRRACQAFGSWEEGGSHAIVRIPGSNPPIITIPRHTKVRAYVVHEVVAAMEVFLESMQDGNDAERGEGSG